MVGGRNMADDICRANIFAFLLMLFSIVILEQRLEYTRSYLEKRQSCKDLNYLNG